MNLIFFPCMNIMIFFYSDLSHLFKVFCDLCMYILIHSVILIICYVIQSVYFSTLWMCIFSCMLLLLVAPHSSTLAWKIPWTEEPGRLQSMGLLRVRHDWATSLSLFTFMYWRRKWQPNPVFLPGEPQGRGSLVGCRLWGHTESDATEAT